jgi:hypothetical protein
MITTWVLIIAFTTANTSQKVEGLSQKACAEQAAKINESKLPAFAICVEKK